MVNNEKDLLEWAELVVFNKKKEYYSDLISQYPDKSFLDLIRINGNIQKFNYEGICW